MISKQAYLAALVYALLIGLVIWSENAHAAGRLCCEETVQQITECKSDGVGRALLGGLLFGRTGAHVGALTANQHCTTREERSCVRYESPEQPCAPRPSPKERP
jgi:hypothetical protein